MNDLDVLTDIMAEFGLETVVVGGAGNISHTINRNDMVIGKLVLALIEARREVASSRLSGGNEFVLSGLLGQLAVLMDDPTHHTVSLAKRDGVFKCNVMNAGFNVWEVHPELDVAIAGAVIKAETAMQEEASDDR